MISPRTSHKLTVSTYSWSCNPTTKDNNETELQSTKEYQSVIHASLLWSYRAESHTTRIFASQYVSEVFDVIQGVKNDVTTW